MRVKNVIHTLSSESGLQFIDDFQVRYYNDEKMDTYVSSIKNIYGISIPPDLDRSLLFKHLILFFQGGVFLEKEVEVQKIKELINHVEEKGITLFVCPDVSAVSHVHNYYLLESIGITPPVSSRERTAVITATKLQLSSYLDKVRTNYVPCYFLSIFSLAFLLTHLFLLGGHRLFT